LAGEFAEGIVKILTSFDSLEDGGLNATDELEEIFFNSLDLIGMGTLDGRFTRVNPAFERILGYSEREVLSAPFLEFIVPEDLEAAEKALTSASSGELKKIFIETRCRCKDGLIKFIDWRVSADAEKNLFIAVGRDISERKQIEKELRVQKARFAESQRIAHIGSWEHNIETNHVYWSDELFRLLGLDPQKDDADFDMFFSMVHPEDQPALKDNIEKTLLLRSPFNVDYRFILKDGRTRILRAMAELIPDGSGKFVILSGTAQDVTARKQVKAAIEKKSRIIESIVNLSPDILYIYDLDENCNIYCNQGVRQVLGYSVQEIQEMGSEMLAALMHPDDFKVYTEKIMPQYRLAQDGEQICSQYRMRRKNGEWRWMESRESVYERNADGKPCLIFGASSDVTERHMLEIEQLKTQKLEAIGTLAGGIAHDFNNLLQGVFGYISMARMELDEPGKLEEMLTEAEKALSLSVNLTSQLLTFAKGGAPVKELLDMRPVIENAAKFALSGSRCGYHLHLAHDLWPVEADEGQMSQVLQNIILNASDAMPGGGIVEFSAENLNLPHGERQIRIAVKDSGVGIPEEHKEKVFDPYFTTKHKGSGLGLATSYSIVKKHGGSIQVQSEENKGSSFFITIPACGPEFESVEECQIQTVDSDALVRKARILLMDDEKIIRDVACRMIKLFGYEVEAACSGEEAIDKYRAAMAFGNPFDLVILDLTIKGGMGGQEAVKKLLKIDPDARAVVSSGYSDDPVLSEYSKYGFKGLLTKPYKVNDLKRRLKGWIEHV